MPRACCSFEAIAVGIESSQLGDELLCGKTKGEIRELTKLHSQRFMPVSAGKQKASIAK
jgi:hypothetical protein